MPISAVPDHVAIAVPDLDASLVRWRDTLGGVVGWRFHNPTRFRGATVQYRGGAYLELLAPSDATDPTASVGGPAGFLEDYLDRFGAGVHHVTLKVPDLAEAVDRLTTDGFDVLDVDDSDEHWHEAFLRPSQVGGMVVQVAWTDLSPVEFAASEGTEHPPTPTAGARLLGPHLAHDDLGRAAAVWTSLGGDVVTDDDGVTVSWPDAPLTVTVTVGPRPTVLGLRFTDAAPRPDDPALGPAVLAGPS